MKKQKTSVALSILLFSSAMAFHVGVYAQQATAPQATAPQPGAQQPVAPDAEPLSRHTEAVPDSPPNTESDAPVSSQAKSKGFIEDSHLNLLLRSFSEHDTFNTVKNRDAWVLGAQAVFESGYTKGLIGLGGDVSLFGALKLNGGQGAGNLIHVNSDGQTTNQLAWAYPGVWDVKARISNTVLKYGQHFRAETLMQYDSSNIPLLCF